MRRFRVWEANRKVFLYPENWIRSELRDDRSPFFDELQSGLLQDDLTEPAFADGLRAYIAKVHSVANLHVVGLYATNPQVLGNETDFDQLYIFARTRSEPFQFFYRSFDHRQDDGLVVDWWRPWKAIQADIPSYARSAAPSSERGTLLVPVVWRRRLLIFAPQIEIVSEAADYQTWAQRYAWDGATWPDPATKVFWAQATERERADFPAQSDPVDSGDREFNAQTTKIVLCGHDLTGARSSGKLLSTRPVLDRIPCQAYLSVKAILPSTIQNLSRGPGVPAQVGDIGEGRFSKRVLWSRTRNVDGFRFTTSEDAEGVLFGVLHRSDMRGGFFYDGTQIGVGYPPVDPTRSPTSFHYLGGRIYSLQLALDGAVAPFATDGSTFTTTINPTSTASSYRLGNSLAHRLLLASKAASIDSIFGAFDGLGAGALPDAFGGDVEHPNELRTPNALYNWEASFHAPMLACEQFLKAQRFEEALGACRLVFDPLAKGDGPTRYWRFRPFQTIDATSTLQGYFLSLQAGVPDPRIGAWRSNPFQPHLVARDRPSAYMKWVVMKYVEILIAHGDYYFRQNTLEALPLATQCYVTASALMGRPGETIPRRGVIRPQSYNSLLEQWDAFGNALVDLELRFPHSQQRSTPPADRVKETHVPNIFGFATTLYFCIPDNPKLREMRETIDNRLFKIRHCQDINGVFVKRPLFEPPIDPALLVEASAQGISLSTVLDEISGPMPNCRFTYLLQKALELCSEVKSLGAAFLSAKEKKDGEHIGRLRSTHEGALLKLVLDVRQAQLDESKKSLDALLHSRKGPEYRLRHFLQLIGGDLSSVPDADKDFSELQNLIDAPSDESGLKISGYEKVGLDKARDSAGLQAGIGVLETLAGVFNALPTVNAHGTPFGVGAAVCWGPPNLGAATSAVARAIRIGADLVAFEGARASTLGGLQRSVQDRIHQANSAGYEIKNIDKQTLTQRIRIQIAENEIRNHQRQIDNAEEVDEFLRSKYTNEELYAYEEGQLRQLHQSAYELAYDLAKKAERAFQFERGLTTSDFVKFGDWEPGRDGLFAGERLYQGLKRLEAAHLERRAHDFEVTKHVSLRQLNPLALYALRENGAAEFELPEFLFDLDFPGHYKRRIRSVSMSVPCVVGPYTSLNCTLRLLEHRFRAKPNAPSKAAYPQDLTGDDDRFMTVSVPISSIAVSEGRTDAGVFELNFRDERYVPFEGAGAISKWRVELSPMKLRPFDFRTITDVVLHLRYTSVDGGDTLREVATGATLDRINEVGDLAKDQGLFVIVDLEHELASEWSRFARATTGATERTMDLRDMVKRLPFLASARPVDKIKAVDVIVLSGDDLSGMSLTLTVGEDSIPFGEKVLLGQRAMGILDGDLNCEHWKLQRTSPDEIKSAWMVVRIKLT